MPQPASIYPNYNDVFYQLYIPWNSKRIPVVTLHHTWDRQHELAGVTKTVVGLTEGVTVDV